MSWRVMRMMFHESQMGAVALVVVFQAGTVDMIRSSLGGAASVLVCAG